MERDDFFPDDQLQDGKSRNKTERRTIYLSDAEMEKFPLSEDDYRIPRVMPDVPARDETGERGGSVVPVVYFSDDGDNVSDMEKHLLEDAELDLSSDETNAAALLDGTDEDGDQLNESMSPFHLFDTGEELDIPPDIINPDGSIDEMNDTML